MNGWYAVLMVLGCALAAPMLGWLVVRVILPKSRGRRTAKRNPDDRA